MSVKLNLGCGKDIREGWCNCDRYPLDDRVLKLDLAELPLPFPDDYADEIMLRMIVEHLVYQNEFMFEINRILKPGGKVTVILPCFNVGMDHKTVIHSEITLKSLLKETKTTHNTPQPFHLIKFEYKNGGIKVLFRNLIQIFKILYFRDCEWKLRK